MATRAVKQHKTKPARRTPRREPSRGLFDVLLTHEYRRWRKKRLGPNEIVRRLIALAPSMPIMKWYASSGRWEILRVEDEQTGVVRLSARIDVVTGADDLEIYDTRYFHPALDDEPVEFYVRSIDTKDIERTELLERSSNVLSDYDPVAKFEQEVGLRRETVPLPAPLSKKPAPTSAPKKKRRKAKQPSPPTSQTAPGQQPGGKTGPGSINAEAAQRPSAEQSPQESKVDGWQVRRVKQALQELFPPDGHPPLEMALKAILKRINEEFFKPRHWKFASLDSLARAMGRRT
jgi:hypothetical protein